MVKPNRALVGNPLPLVMPPIAKNARKAMFGPSIRYSFFLSVMPESVTCLSLAAPASESASDAMVSNPYKCAIFG